MLLAIKHCCGQEPRYWVTCVTEPPEFEYSCGVWHWCIRCEICKEEYTSTKNGNDVIDKWNKRND